MRRKVFILLIILVGIGITVLAAQQQQNLQQKAAEFLNPSIQIENFSQKDISETEGVLHVALYNSEGTVYKTSAQDAAAAAEIIQENPYLQEYDQEKRLLLPAAVSDNIRLEKSVQDKSDAYLEKQGFVLENEHYFYTQFINDIPVFGSNVAIHVKNNNEIYAVDADALTNLQIPSEVISQDRAQQIAIDDATKELGNTDTTIIKTKKYVVNLSLLGITQDARNHLALSVIVAAPKDAPKPFEKEYLVDLTNGEILQSTSLIQDAINRSIYSCDGNPSCPLARSEGSPTGTDTDVNNTYDFLGLSYNFFQNSFRRDSYDNAGAAINAYAHYPSGCPNAFWSSTYQSLFFCNGLAVNDVVGHELGHAVTEHTSGLYYSYQSGAINESLSDIWGYAIDQQDWTMGEDSSLGAIRYMDDPPKKNQPDRIFSDKYYCNAGDNGGVHYNSGILNKAFYLMVGGGNFNGCTMTGVGKDAAFNTVYKANLSYLTQFSNYYDLYIGLTRACNDLYGSSSNTCMQIQKALRVTEMDQQSANLSVSPKCSGVTPRAPQCDTDPSQPTWTPIPTPFPTITPTPGQQGENTRVDTIASTSPYEAGDPIIKADSNGHVYYFWLEYVFGSSSYPRKTMFRRSNDYGQTFVGNPISLPAPRNGSYPTLKICNDNSGHIYMLSNYSLGPSIDNHIYLNYSSDYGATWASSDMQIDHIPAGFNHSPEPQIACHDNGRVYVVWADERIGGQGKYNIFFNASSDFGKTWAASDTRIDINEQPSKNSSGFPQISIDNIGHLYVSWHVINDDDINNVFHRIMFANSADHGVTWQATPLYTLSNKIGSASPPMVSSDNTGHVYVAWVDSRSGNSQAYFKQSSDFGQTWQSQDKRISSLENKYIYFGLPVLITADSSGHVYAAWQGAGRQSNIGVSKIFFNYSSDYGLTWQPNDIHIDGDTGIYQARNLKLVKSDNGNVAIAWEHEPACFPDCINAKDIYFNYSTDFGKTWRVKGIRVDNAPDVTYQGRLTFATDNNAHVYAGWLDNQGTANSLSPKNLFYAHALYLNGSSPTSTPTPTPQPTNTPTPSPRPTNTPTPTLTPTPTSPFACEIYGDLNLDGRVTALDADIVSKIVSGQQPTGNSSQTGDNQYMRTVGDVTGDQNITSEDALRIRKYADGSETTFPVCQEAKLPPVGCNNLGDVTTDGKVTPMDAFEALRMNLRYPDSIYTKQPYTDEQKRRANVNLENNSSGEPVDSLDSLLILRYFKGMDATLRGCNKVQVSSSPKPALCTACSADSNKDGQVSTVDYSLMVSCYDQTAAGRCAGFDTNQSGKVDIEDAACVINQFGNKCGQ